MADVFDTSDNERRKKALMDAMDAGEPGGFAGSAAGPIDVAGPRIENTGIAGGLPPWDGKARIPDGSEPGGFAGPATGPLVDAPAAPAYTPIRGKNAGQDSVILGYDRGKLNDPTYTKGTKYNSEVRDFKAGLDADVGLQRGGLDNMISFLQNEKGRKNAVAVGDDKIDFDGPGPLPPIDVIRGGDNAIVFQDPRGAVGGGGGSSDGLSSSGGPLGAAQGYGTPIGGYALDQALSGDPIAKIQQMLQQLSGSRPNFDALMAQLGRT